MNDQPAPPAVSPPPSLPAVPRDLIAHAARLRTLCAALKAAGVFAFDTEFIGENTYHPILCLIQVATADHVELIDPLAISRDDMLPFWQLLADESLEKICHAGDQDVEIAWQHSGLVPRNMFDTQIGAGMLGISYPTALWRAVEHFCGVTLEKAHTYSAWDRRPLSPSQFSYAVDDVRYLPAIHAAMKRNLAQRHHDSWMRAACDEMVADSAGPVEARTLYLKIRGAANLSPTQLAALREVTALREQIAYEHDVPARTFLKDEVLLDLATKLPTTEAALARIRDLPRTEIDSYGPALLEAIARGAASKDELSIHIPGDDPAEVKRLSETLWVATQVICLGQSVTPSLVASQNEVLALARLIHRNKPLDQHPLMKSWHGECLGQKLAAFIQGKLQIDLTMHHGTLHGQFEQRP